MLIKNNSNKKQLKKSGKFVSIWGGVGIPFLHLYVYDTDRFVSS